jgi:hypothetical protein
VKIAINSPIMGDKIISLLSEYRENGIALTFIKKTGIRIEFEVSGIDGQSAIDLVKTLIKNTEFGKVLYFNVIEA